MTPDAENECGTAVAVAVAISHYQQCHIANVPLPLHQGNDDCFWSQLIGVMQQ